MTTNPQKLEQQARELLAAELGTRPVTLADNKVVFVEKAIRAIIKALSLPTMEERARIGWQPIETAPKDGSYLLFAGDNFDGGMAVVHWDDDFDWWTLDDGKNPEIMLRAEDKLTHWMPLPEPPGEHLTHHAQEGGE